MNTRAVPTSGFGGAAGFSVVELWAQSALTKACPRPVAKSFLHVGDAVVRRQDMWDMRVAQVFDSCHLLPSSFGEECVLQEPESIG